MRVIDFDDLFLRIDGSETITEREGDIIGHFDACLARPFCMPALMSFLFSLEILRSLREGGIPVINEPEAYLIGANKLTQYGLLSSAGIPVPRTTSSLKTSALVSSISGSKRAIAKPICGSRGKGIMEVKPGMPLRGRKGSVILIQDFVRASNYDVRAFVVGCNAIAWMKRVSSGLATNISKGSSPEEFVVDERTESLASKAASVVHAAIAGVDIAFDENGDPFVLEVNSQPDFIGLEKISKNDIGYSIVDLMVRIASGARG